MIIDLLTLKNKSYFYYYNRGNERVLGVKFATFTDYLRADGYLNFIKSRDYNTGITSNIIVSSKSLSSEEIETLVLDYERV